jgi:glycosyltransferase involved in cell wall biosynthesis
MDFLLDDYRVKPHFIPEFKRAISPVSDIAALWKASSFMRRYRPHIVHTHTSKAGLVGRLAALFTGVPVIVHTFHGHTFHGYFGRVSNGIFLAIERMLARFTDVVIAISPLQREDIVERYRVADGSKCRTILLGLDLGKYLALDLRSKRRAELGFGDQDFVVGTVGRITDIKNHRLFVDVARLFCERKAAGNVRFVIVGDGELRPDLERYIDEQGMRERVSLFGWQRDMAKVYSAFDVFLLTSRNEGTPVSMIEAMASGVPAVSTDVGGIPDVITHNENGYLVKDFDKSDFADRIAALVDNGPARYSMGLKARDSVKEKFHKERLIREMRSLYKELVKKKGAA